MKAITNKPILIPTIPLLIGGLVYVLWRSPSLLMFRWFQTMGIMPGVTCLRTACAGIRPHLPAWILYSFPDAAWSSCGLLTFAAIWAGSRNPARHVWIALPPVLAISGEFGQLVHFIPGTFDPADVIAYLFATFLSLIVARRHFSYALRHNQNRL